MECNNCLFEGNCILKRFAEDLTGCEGHSKKRLSRKGEVRCSCCGKWVDESQTFKHKVSGKYLCFDCY